jgi:tetratricopeptide (TPR) repeat protein
MTAVSRIDDQTAAAIRDAMRAASAGHLAEAAEIGERALADGGDPVALNALIGSLRCRAGEHEAGITHLRAANNGRPDDPVIAANLATALVETGDYAAVLELLSPEFARTDSSMRLERLRGFAAQMTEDFETAIASYERVVAAAPNDWESWNNLGNSRRLFGDFEGSVAALGRARALTPGSPPVYLNYALAVASTGRTDEAEGLLRQIADEFPNDVKALTELHSLYKEQARDDEALEALQTALQRQPEDTGLILGLASHQLSMLQTDAAEESYRRAISIEPDSGPANLGLGLVFELTNRGEELSRLVKEGDARGIPPNASNFLQALDHRRAKRFAEGLEALAKVPEEVESSRRWHLLGQLYEGVGRYDEAFAAFAKMNENHLADPSAPEQRAAAYRDRIATQRGTVTAPWLARWRKAQQTDDRPSPVFLVGFPRSGTTLLDTMLMGHGNVEVLEEEPTLLNAIKFLPEFDEIPEATDAQISAARDEYFRTAATLTPLGPGKVLVDKNPLSMNGLPIIARLFPDARIILALRHPCDVVLSCYITNFKLNAGMSNFIRLDTAAELYDLSFRYLERVQEVMPLPMHKVLYEKVVADQESELRSLFDFLSIEFHDDVLNHQATARDRGRIKTASYAQVFEPIYTRSAGRWHNYRKHLEPILPVLGPWVRKFGYEL